MSEPPADAPREPRRRPRYRGTHPRRFEEKYKELAPEDYPELVEHVRERGQTPAGQHVPILVEEVLRELAPRPGERGVDATLGYGGHAERLLAAVSPGGRLLGLDADPIELPKTQARLTALGYDSESLLVRRTNFAGLGSTLAGIGWSDGVDFLFADLGVSSMQLDDPARGFSFKFDGPLDLRMNPSRGLSAAQWLERASEARLCEALEENADEPHARRIANALRARPRRIESTLQLADAVRAALSTRVGAEDVELSVRRVFQALRIEVNDEFGALDSLLRQLPECLRAGARVALLSFHSGEDRRVKRAFELGLRKGFFASITDEVLRASPAERRANPRSTSAKLRCARRPS